MGKQWLAVLSLSMGLMCALFVGGDGKSYAKRSSVCDDDCTAACGNDGGGCCGQTGNCKDKCYCFNSGYANRCTNCDI